MSGPFDAWREERAILRSEARADVKQHGFIQTRTALALERVGVDSVQLEADLRDDLSTDRYGCSHR